MDCNTVVYNVHDDWRHLVQLFAFNQHPVLQSGLAGLGFGEQSYRRKCIWVFGLLYVVLHESCCGTVLTMDTSDIHNTRFHELLERRRPKVSLSDWGTCPFEGQPLC